MGVHVVDARDDYHEIRPDRAARQSLASTIDAKFFGDVNSARAVALGIFVLVMTGCLPQARRVIHAQSALLATYAQVPMEIPLETLDTLLASLSSTTGQLCLSFDKPCLVSLAAETDSRAFCLQWGKHQQCFGARSVASGLLLTAGTTWTPTQEWLCEALDPAWDSVREKAEAVAEEEVAASERTPVAMSTFWAQARATGSLGGGIGVQGQGGYRRWMSQYLLLSVGAGYERTLLFALPGNTNALLFTGRVELSSFDESWQKAHLGLPALSGYFGITGVVGLSAQPSWTTRAFVGLSCIAPLSFEVGVAVGNEGTGAPRLYAAVGLGL